MAVVVDDTASLEACQSACTAAPACHAIQTTKKKTAAKGWLCALWKVPTRGAGGCTARCYAAVRKTATGSLAAATPNAPTSRAAAAPTTPAPATTPAPSAAGAATAVQATSPAPTTAAALFKPQQVAACANHSPTINTQKAAHCAVVNFSQTCVDGCGWSPARASCTPRSQTPAGSARAKGAAKGAVRTVTVAENPGTAYQPQQLPTPAAGCRTKGGEDSWANAGWHNVANTGMMYRWHPLRVPWAVADKFCRGFGEGFGLLDSALWGAHDSFRREHKYRNLHDSYKSFWISGGAGGKGCSIIAFKNSGKVLTEGVPCDSSHAYVCTGKVSAPWHGPGVPPIDGASTARRPVGKRRNVVVMMADDWGWGDLPGKNEDVIMPHIKDMQRHSVQFERFYASAPVCSPTRSTVLTGMFPAR